MIAKAPIWLCAVLLAMAGCGLANASNHNPCALHPTRRGWHVFVDYRDGFCFEYPHKYRIAPAVFSPGYMPDPKIRFIGRLTTKPSSNEPDNPHVAEIDVYDEGYPFRLKDLIQFWPIDEDNAPPLVHAAHADFYYCGPGGGGVSYPDDYFFGARGRTFSISFDGPYKGDRTPDAETKRIEPEVLASFRTF
ncbi:MAG TPA: hypothetical protein VMD25_10925 [Acidobacteriaceae bacterium]|nr:hypothetical protein [Acidobacteriaceae bacterium]